MYSGNCECKGVGYQFNGEPLTCYTCHCTDCQTTSGSAFGLAMIVNEDDLKIIQGELSVSTVDYNGTKVQRHHCKQCGTTLWLSADTYPDIVALKPGTFDDTGWFKPVAHLWTRSAQPWVCLDASIPQYEKQPKFTELFNLWATRKSIDPGSE